MTTEQIIALLALAVGFIGGLLGPWVSARFASRRLERTLEADRKKELIDTRRKLLDEGAVLLIEAEVALKRFVEEMDYENPEKQGKRLERFGNELARFRARLDLWFDEGSDVVKKLTRVISLLEERGMFIEGEHGRTPVSEMRRLDWGTIRWSPNSMRERGSGQKSKPISSKRRVRTISERHDPTSPARRPRHPPRSYPGA